MTVYGDDEDWFRKEWAKTGKKLDMGKCCVRFKKLDDVALDVIGKAIRRVSAKQFIEHYELVIKGSRKKAATKTKGSSAAKAKERPKSATSKTSEKKPTRSSQSD